MKRISKRVEEKFDSDWLFLLILGIIVALISFGLDFSIDKCQQGIEDISTMNYLQLARYIVDFFLSAHLWLYSHATDNVFAQYLIWVLFPVALIFFSVGFTHLVSPHAIGMYMTGYCTEYDRII
jgi:chloride channel 2